MKIYTTFGRQKTVRIFLEKLFSSEYNFQRIQNICTYLDPECKIVQCYKDKFRSFDDIYDCVNTYYKNITPKALIHLLLTLNKKTSSGKELYLHMANCSTINKIRMLYYCDQHSCYNSAFTCSKYGSKWSWKELLEMLGIKSIEDIKNYVNKYKK